MQTTKCRLQTEDCILLTVNYKLQTTNFFKMATQGFNIKINGIIGFVFMVMVFVIFIGVAKALFKFSLIIAAVLIVLALLINYRTVLGYLKFILSLLKRNVLGGVIGIVLSVIGFPILAGVLFGKSIRRVNL